MRCQSYLRAICELHLLPPSVFTNTRFLIRGERWNEMFFEAWTNYELC